MTYSESKDRLLKAKSLSLVDFLTQEGYELHDTGSYFRCLSPLRNEGNGSFDISKKTGRWRDRGNGRKGDTIDFIREYRHCSMKEAIDFLLSGEKLNLTTYEPVKREKNAIELLSVGAIISPELIDYITLRCFGLKQAKKWLYEAKITFPYSRFNPEREHLCLAMRSDLGGYEFRGVKIKHSNAPKSITTIHEGTKDVLLFEGFPDFLSYLTFLDIIEPEYTTYILNSLSFLDITIPFLRGCNVHYFGQNDNAAEESFQKLKESGIDVIDEREFYRGHKDLNKWWVNKAKKKGYLSDILKF